MLFGTIVLIGAGCNYSTKSTTDNENTSQTTNSISIKNLAFAPSTITITPGTEVTWTNNDALAHDIKADTFSSDILKPGEKYSYTFSKAGTFTYICSIHPNMSGTIIVK